MRVLLAHNRYRLAGGEERHVDLLAGALQDAGVTVRRFERDSSELERSRVRAGLAGLTLAYRPGGGGIERVLREFRPTVVHFHNLWPLLTPAALRTARRSGAAVVLTAHNYRFACPSGTLLRNGRVHEDCIEGSSLLCGLRGARDNRAESAAYGLALEIQRRARMLGRWADAFVAPTAFMRQMLVRSGQPADRVFVLANGVPIPEEATEPGDRVLFAGRLSAEKGVRTLIEAAELVPDVQVTIAGSGPLAEALHTTPSNVSVVGSLDRAGLARALDSAAMVLVPSEWYENLPFSALEALAAGRPVIATRMGGLPEIVEDGLDGLLVDPWQPASLAAAIDKLWGDRTLVAEMGAAARARAREHFDLQTQTERMIDLYERVARDRRSASA